MSDWERAGRAYDEAEEKRRATAEKLAEIEAAAAAEQRRFAEQIDGYVQAFLESMARAGNPGSTRYRMPVRLWPSNKFWEVPVPVGREWVYYSHWSPASGRRGSANSELAVHTNGNWSASRPTRYQPPGDASAARVFDGLAGVRVDPEFVEWVLTRLTEWLRENGVPLPT